VGEKKNSNMKIVACHFGCLKKKYPSLLVICGRTKRLMNQLVRKRFKNSNKADDNMIREIQILS